MHDLPRVFEQRMVDVLGSRDELERLLTAETRRALRVNPLKTTPQEIAARLSALGIETEPVGFAEGLLFYEDPAEARSIGAIFEHQAGLVFSQDAASALPILALDPQPGEAVLDLCAAPGSKTTHIAERMDARGMLVANDLHPGRVNNLISNLDQTGCLNTVVTQADGCRLEWPLTFDKVLVDAPCSNLGHMHADWNPIKRYDPKSVEQLCGVQRSLLRAAFHATRAGGTIVYSTCTIEPKENEGVVSWFLDEHAVELDAFEPGIGQEGWLEAGGESYHEGCADALRVEAGEHGTEGFFVARFTKLEDTSFEDGREGPWRHGQMEQAPEGTMADLVEAYGLVDERVGDMRAVTSPSKLYGTTVETLDEALDLAPDRVGLYLAKPEQMGPRMSFDAATLVGRGAEQRIELDPTEARRWLSGQPVEIGEDVPVEWHVITCLGEPIGCARPFGSELPCYVPKRQRVPDDGIDRIGFLALEGV